MEENIVFRDLSAFLCTVIVFLLTLCSLTLPTTVHKSKKSLTSKFPSRTISIYVTNGIFHPMCDSMVVRSLLFAQIHDKFALKQLGMNGFSPTAVDSTCIIHIT